MIKGSKNSLLLGDYEELWTQAGGSVAQLQWMDSYHDGMHGQCCQSFQIPKTIERSEFFTKISVKFNPEKSTMKAYGSLFDA